MEDIDLEKLQFYINATFYFDQGILFSDIVKQPTHKEIVELKRKMTKTEIERLYNHFHLNAISEDLKGQREIAGKLWESWRTKLSKCFPSNNIIIEIQDLGVETIFYVWEEI